MSSCFLWVIRREISVFSKLFISKIIDIVIIASTNILVFAYIMPHFGFKNDYGVFIFLNLIPMITLFEVIPKTSEFVADITGPKKISYMLTLPMNSSHVFIAIGIGWAITTAIISLLMLPLGKLFLMSKFSLSEVSIWRFLLIFIASNLFFSFFALFLTGLIKEMKYMGWVWVRVVNPMFMLGCYFYSWYSLFEASKIAGYINLINPIIYAVEGLRGSILGQKGTISFIYCFIALVGFCLIFGYFGIKMLKKRLDCI